MQIAEGIRRHRQKAELTTTELAYHLEKSAQTIMAYESGTVTPPLGVVQRLADLFGTSIDELTGRTPNDR